MPIDKIAKNEIDRIEFDDNLKEKLAGVLKEIPKWHLRGVREVSFGYINGSDKPKLYGNAGCCFWDGRIVLDYPTTKIFPKRAIEFIELTFVHELGHNIFDSLLPFRIKHRWAGECRKNNIKESAGEIFASEYQNAILLKKDTSLYSNMAGIFNFLERNKHRKCNGNLHKYVSYKLYSKSPKAKSI